MNPTQQNQELQQFNNVLNGAPIESSSPVKSFEQKINDILSRASLKDIVNISRQMAALLEAGVNILKAFQLVSEDQAKPFIKASFEQIVNDIKSGSSVSQALVKHPKIFDDFYVNMVRSGEESGKMSGTFLYLADYMERNYNLAKKVKNALIYPSFVIGTFFIVMILVFTMVIPQLAVILTESGVPLPTLTRIVLAISTFLVNYGIYFGIIGAVTIVYFWVTYKDTDEFSKFFDKIKIKAPIVKNIFQMFYVTRIADNTETLLTSGVSLTKSIQITSDVVGNYYYRQILLEALNDIKSGVAFSQSLSKHKDLIPSTIVQMVRIGEETGETAKLLGNAARFYQKEINSAVDTMVGLIEPVMIVMLGLGVGTLLVSVLMPIYNLAGAF